MQHWIASTNTTPSAPVVRRAASVQPVGGETSGVVRIAEKAAIPSVYLGDGPRNARRFRLRDITKFEGPVTV